MTTTDPMAEHCARLSTWVRAYRAWQRLDGSMPQPPAVEDVQWLLDDRAALLLALRDARDGLAARVATCTTRAADLPGGDKECQHEECACEHEGEAEGLTGGALAIGAIITRFWGREATL